MARLYGILTISTQLLKVLLSVASPEVILHQRHFVLTNMMPKFNPFTFNVIGNKTTNTVDSTSVLPSL